MSIYLEHLRTLTGDPDAAFRPGQLEAIRAVVEQRRRALVVQRTGWGKSAVYLIATKVNRDKGRGPTVIVSPLLALMRNQLAMARKLDLDAFSIDSTNPEDWPEVFERIRTGRADLLLVSPERLANQEFSQTVLPELLDAMDLLVIDEVHCISDWGHDFRPDYRRLGSLVRSLPPKVAVLGTTATANTRVVEDIREQLGTDIDIYRGTLDRESLKLYVIHAPDRAVRLAWLARYIPELPGSGIVYCLTVADAHRVADFLRSRGIQAAAYTGPMDHEERLAIERRLSDADLKVVVATSALAMGYDNPAIQFVIHYQVPGSPIAYYQQVGRAGRAVDTAYGVALAGGEDKDIQDWFIDTAFPAESEVLAVLRALEASPGLTVHELMAHVNLSYGRLASLLKVLEVEGAIYKDGRGWYRSADRWEYPHERIRGITEQRRIEQDQMAAYLQTDGCLMQFLRATLDDPMAEPCGRCGNCLDRHVEPNVDEHTLEAARRFLNSLYVDFEPRKRAPAGLAAELALDRGSFERGRALTRWGDSLGQLVREGKYESGRFPDELVDRFVGMIGEWSLDPRPEWVTAVPSRSGSDLVVDLAKRVAQRRGLPFIQAVRRTDVPVSPQKEMRNSFHQARNALQAFTVPGKVPIGPVLLVDDIVDSRWTLTVVANKLRRAGAGPVYAAALADTSNRG